MPIKTFWKLIVLIALLFSSLTIATPATATPNPPRMAAKASLLMDLASGRVLYQQNGSERMYPASTTKILTAMVALERGQMDELITIGVNPPRVEGTRVYLKAGEQQTLEDLLYAMMLNSGNDAALAIAEHIGGSMEGFARMMNQKARELGATGSNFINPHGLHHPDHYSTAADLAKITRAAMANAKFRQIVATRTREWQGAVWESTLVNHNRLLGVYEGIAGVKTGYTSQAGYNLVAAATRGTDSFLAVVLNSNARDVFNDASALLDYGFANFHNNILVEEGQQVAYLTGPKDRQYGLVAETTLRYLGQAGGPVPTGIIKLERWRGPLTQGQRAGEMVFRLDGSEVGRVSLVAAEDWPGGLSASEWWLRISLSALLIFLVGKIVGYRRSRRRYRHTRPSRMFS